MGGRVVNTVECHSPGFCFFSVWRFYDDSLPGTSDDCLWWCQTTTPSDPSSCVASGVVRDENGDQICHKDGKGAVHGMTVGKTDPQDPKSFDLFLLFTGKGTFDQGDSSIYRLRVQVSTGGADGDKVKVLTSRPWGVDLWQKTVQSPEHDVGVDHAWIDDEGQHVWVGTFRKKNDGVHMLEYDTGRLIHSIHGISSIRPDKYSYTSGIHGVGSYGKPGSFLAVATCEEYGQQFKGGTSDVVLIDISGIRNITLTDVGAATLVV